MKRPNLLRGRGATEEDQGDAAVGLTIEPEVVRQLNVLGEERRRARALVAAEEERIERLEGLLREADKSRIGALADARVANDPVAKSRAEQLRADCDSIGRELADARAVAERLKERVAPLTKQISGLQARYQRELENFLNGLYAKLVDRYLELASPAADVVLQVAALHRVMMRLRTGNSNGWNGEAYFPGMKAFEGRFVPSILNTGGPDFPRQVDMWTGEIMDQVCAAGFTWNFD